MLRQKTGSLEIIASRPKIHMPFLPVFRRRDVLYSPADPVAIAMQSPSPTLASPAEVSFFSCRLVALNGARLPFGSERLSLPHQVQYGTERPHCFLILFTTKSALLRSSFIKAKCGSLCSKKRAAERSSVQLCAKVHVVGARLELMRVFARVPDHSGQEGHVFSC